MGHPATKQATTSTQTPDPRGIKTRIQLDPNANSPVIQCDNPDSLLHALFQIHPQIPRSGLPHPHIFNLGQLTILKIPLLL
tara:strand:- start:257 stop:499 length:243 start_codon:yes stop_codon:yes gene_type:complete